MSIEKLIAEGYIHPFQATQDEIDKAIDLFAKFS